MNNQQAINLLKGLEKNLDDYCELNDEGKTAFGMAITALELFGNSEQLPSIHPDTTTHDSIPAETDKNDGDRTSGDCISRRASLEKIRTMQTYKLFAGDDMILIDKAQVQTELMMLPSVQPFRIITMTDVMKRIDDMSEDEWQEFTACLECRGWELQRRTAKWCGGNFA